MANVYHEFSAHQLGAYKKRASYRILVEHNNETQDEIVTKNILISLLNLIEQVNPKDIKNATFQLYSDLLKGANICGTGVINNRQKTALLAIIEKAKEDFNHNTDNGIIPDTPAPLAGQQQTTDNSELDWISFKKDRIFFDILNNRKRAATKRNHCVNLDSHIANGTTPSQLFFCRFPTPFLNRDEEFVEKYNKIIQNTQLEIMKLSIERLGAQAIDLDKELEKILDELSGVNVAHKETIVKKVQEEAIQLLKPSFDKADEKIKRIIARPFITARSHTQRNNMSLNTNTSSCTHNRQRSEERHVSFSDENQYYNNQPRQQRQRQQRQRHSTPQHPRQRYNYNNSRHNNTYHQNTSHQYTQYHDTSRLNTPHHNASRHNNFQHNTSNYNTSHRNRQHHNTPHHYNQRRQQNNEQDRQTNNDNRFLDKRQSRRYHR